MPRDNVVYVTPFNGALLHARLQSDPWEWTVYLPGAPSAKNPSFSMALRYAYRGWSAAGRPTVGPYAPFPLKGATQVGFQEIAQQWVVLDEIPRLTSLFRGETEGFIRLKAKIIRREVLLDERQDQAVLFPYNPDVPAAEYKTTRIADFRFGTVWSEFGVLSLHVYLNGTFRVGSSSAISSDRVVPQLEAMGRALEFIRIYELTAVP